MIKNTFAVLLSISLLFSAVPLAAENEPAPAAANILDEGMPAEGLSQKVTMDLKGVDILDVLKILSKRTGMNIVAGRNVQGNVTLYLQNVDVWSALKKILETADLAYMEEEGIIRVMTEKDYEEIFGKPFRDFRETRAFNLKNARSAEIAEVLGQIKSNIGRIVVDERTNTIIAHDVRQILDEMAAIVKEMDTPTESRVFTLRYAAVEDLEPKLKSVINPATGTLEIDKRSNKVYVRDLAERVAQVEIIVNEFDAQPYQVLIDAKVVEVALNDQTRFGIDWNTILERSPSNPYKVSAPLTVTNPSSGPLSNITFATVTGDRTGDAGEDDFNFIVSALDGVGKTNTLSSPRLTVLNNQEAKLAVATREPFVSQTVVQGDNTATTADNVQFVDVGVTLTVKPTITSDDFVMIKIKPAVSTAGTPLELQGVASGSNTTFVRTRVPVVTTQEVETTVIVKTGTTIVMGGLIQDRMDKTFRKIPVLGDMPVLGAPFRNKIEDAKKTELVIFLTPYVLKPEIQTKETGRFIDPKGNLLDFDKVGDVDFTDSYRQSGHPFKRKARPYWQRQIQEEIRKRRSLSGNALSWDSLDPNVVEVPIEENLSLDGSRNPVENQWISVEETAVAEIESVVPAEEASPAESAPAPAPAPVETVARDAAESAAPAPEPETADVATDYNSFVPENQSAAIYQQIQDHFQSADPVRATWKSFFRTLRSEIVDALKESPTLKQMHGDVRLEFSITGEGVIEGLEVLDTKHVRGPGQKLVIREALQKRARFSPLPKELGESKKIHLTIRL
ncbi:MAG: hypothetical protein HY714_05300 [Candidatus Omnitrophica bacterium]|nr:hypothetical protein [Candidatus Omnitrophota bacterium]